MAAFLPGFELTDSQALECLSIQESEQRAIRLLRDHEPAEGYYLAFSGGKDSCVCKELLRIAGVRFEGVYNNTTIDPPELVQFIKHFHPDVKWNNPSHGNMMHRIATAPKSPPTRTVRWCCSEYKEGGGCGRVKVFGVRAAESLRRKHGWREISKDSTGNKVVCPIVFWPDARVWEFIREKNLPYCVLYDEGFKRLGCVGCPLASRKNQDKEFSRWPRYERNWKRAIIANWERWHGVPNTKTGGPRFQTKFRNGEDFWEWWRNYKGSDLFRDDCQSGILWTNTED